MNIEKLMNGYILIALFIIILLGRLLSYALTENIMKTLNAFDFYCQIVSLGVYIYCLFLLKKQGKINSFW